MRLLIFASLFVFACAHAPPSPPEARKDGSATLVPLTAAGAIAKPAR